MSRCHPPGAAVFAAFVGAAILACDPGWWVEGVVTLGDGVDPARYAKLHLRAGTADGAYDWVEEEYALDGGIVLAPTPSGFPLTYLLGAMGSFPNPEMRVDATLFVRADGGTPAPGDAKGTAHGLLPACRVPLAGAHCGSARMEPLQLDLIP